ncbi:MerR family transcriptional regulator [Aureibacillus halotolerans]|uniref:Transcriptional regulator n=1 Tax=Aureibacillus halotolerans TaxID=1508390 RepID=A0A4V3D609_9BACI|nr:MerR family transcriptional regulator [Aureibacillus halotolerans]TDQ42157.1 transcriptional regulator [Aureibacillus halotolerans]
MDTEPTSYRDRKVISIGTVSELTGLSERQIRYYEERKLVFPDRTKRGFRKYSFDDVERLMDIADKIEDGVQTFEIRQEMIRKKKAETKENVRENMLRGQLNAHFNLRK